MLPISLQAVFLAALANFIIGFLLHGPILGKLWMKLAKIHPTGKEKFSDMLPQMGLNFLSNLVFAYVLAAVYLFASSSPGMGGTGVLSGMVSAFWVWLGFVVTSTSMEVIWMGKSAKLWLYEISCTLVTSLAMGAIIASW